MTEKKATTKDIDDTQKPYELTQKERDMMALAGDGSGIPKIEYVQDLFFTERGKIPQEILDTYKDRAYMWHTFESIKTYHHTAGGYWEIVTGGNHNQVKNRKLFNESGLITYGAEMLLCFTRRDVTAEKAKVIDMRFSAKVDAAESPNDRVYKHPGDQKTEAGRVIGTTETGRAGFEIDQTEA